MLTRATLKERLDQRIAIDLDANTRKDLAWEIKVVQLAKERFPNVEQLYEAHHQTKLSLTLMKIEHDKNM